MDEGRVYLFRQLERIATYYNIVLKMADSPSRLLARTLLKLMDKRCRFDNRQRSFNQEGF